MDSDTRNMWSGIVPYMSLGARLGREQYRTCIRTPLREIGGVSFQDSKYWSPGNAPVNKINLVFVAEATHAARVAKDKVDTALQQMAATRGFDDWPSDYERFIEEFLLPDAEIPANAAAGFFGVIRVQQFIDRWV